MRRLKAVLGLALAFTCCAPSRGQEEYRFTDDDRATSRNRGISWQTPAMIGDFFGGAPVGLQADSVTDRLVVLANDLDINAVVPGAPLSLTEAGPVGIFASPLASVQQLQTLLIAGQPVPGAVVVGVINDNAVANSVLTAGQIQTQLAATATPYDIIALQAPPGTYANGVAAAFAARNALPGTTTYDAATSGGVLQGGADVLSPAADLDAFYFYNYVVRLNTALADPSSGGTGRMKIAEGGTIRPTDRVFFRYNYLSNLQYSSNGTNLSRFVSGFERTLLGGLASVELRVPFAGNAPINSVYDNAAFTNSSNARFGNLTVYLKGLLLENELLSLSAGTGIVTPTASSLNVSYADGTPLMRIDNRATHLQPFLGALVTPTDRLFIQSFLQCDINPSGNTVSINSNGTGLNRAGRLNDSTYLYADVGVGYWLYKHNTSRGISSVIPTFEVHQNSGLQNGDVVSAGPFQVGNFSGTFNQTNLVMGTTVGVGMLSQFTAAYIEPVSSNAPYNGGLTVFFDRRL